MKIYLYLAILIIVFGLIYSYFPNIKIKTQYIKGKTDTITVVKDSIIYINKYITVTDTFYVNAAGEHASAHFNLQNSVTGVVNYDTPDFSFHDVKIRQKTITNYLTRIDTFKITKFVKNKFHLGFVGGYGVGVQSQKLDFFFGVGVSYDIF